MSEVKGFFGIMKPRFLLLFIVNLLAFTQGLVMDDANKYFIIHPSDFAILGTVKWNMKKALLDIIGVILFGYLAHSFGRKKSIISLGIISLLFQVIYLVVLPEDLKWYDNSSDYPYYYYYDIACKLVHSAPLVISTIYIGETAKDCNRGVFVSSYILSNRLGQIIYSAANFWNILNYLELANIMLSVVFVATAFWLPETPLYLLLNNRTDDAKKALSLLQGNSNIDEGEFQDLMGSVEKSNSSNRTIMSFISYSATRKALIMGFVLLILNRLLYTKHIENNIFDLRMMLRFRKHDQLVLHKTLLVFSSKPALEICGVILTVLLVDRCGRKFLLLISCAGVAFTFVFLNIIFLFQLLLRNNNWLNYFPWLFPTTSFLSFVIYDVGCGNIPYILLSELFQTHARVSGITFCYLFYCILTYLSCTISTWVMLTPSYREIIQYTFSVTIFFSGFLFTYYCVPETKGKSLQDIAEMLKRKGWVTST